MPTVVLMLEAGPTPWEAEGRLVGDSSLPLTAEGVDALRHRVDQITLAVRAVYRPSANEACVQAAQIVTQKFGLRARDTKELKEVSLGLWQGLFPDQIRTRFPTVFPKWEVEPLVVTPPDGESLESAIQRVRSGMTAIIRRNRGGCIMLVLRPMALQIAAGVLRAQTSHEIAAHLRQGQPLETIELPDAA